MQAVTHHEARRSPWRYAARGLVTLALAAGAAFWLLVAGYLAAFRCDEGCSGDQAESWQYDGQAYLALAGAALTAVAMVLGFTPFIRTYRAFLALAVGSAVLWLAWLQSGSF